MSTTTEPSTRRMGQRERAKHARRMLAQERAAKGLDALSESDAWRIIRAGVSRAMAAGKLSESERDCLTSEVAQRAIRSAGVSTPRGWMIPRSRLSGDWIAWTARRLARDQRTWADVADAENVPAEMAEMDRYGRERHEWVTRAPSVDAGKLAERIAEDLSGAMPDTLRVGLVALIEAGRGRGGAYVYGPELAERLGVSLAGLRKSVQRTRAALVDRYPDPADLADAIMSAAAMLPPVPVTASGDGAILPPAAKLAERIIGAAMMTARPSRAGAEPIGPRMAQVAARRWKSRMAARSYGWPCHA